MMMTDVVDNIPAHDASIELHAMVLKYNSSDDFKRLPGDAKFRQFDLCADVLDICVRNARFGSSSTPGYAAQLREKRKEPCKLRLAAETAAAAVNSVRLARIALCRAERLFSEKRLFNVEQLVCGGNLRKLATTRRTNGIAGRTSHAGRSYAPIITGRGIRSDCDRNACVRGIRVLPRSFRPPRTPHAPSVSRKSSCDTCGLPASHRCGGCRGVMYCGPACQKAGWVCHRSSCCPRPVDTMPAQSDQPEDNSTPHSYEPSASSRDSAVLGVRTVASTHSSTEVLVSATSESILPLVAVYVSNVGYVTVSCTFGDA